MTPDSGPQLLSDQRAKHSIQSTSEDLGSSCDGQHSETSETYRKPKKNYGRIAFPAYRDGSWLADFVVNPWIPELIEEVDLRTVDTIKNHYTVRRGPDWSPEQLRRHIETLIQNSPYMAVKGVDKNFWTERILSVLLGTTRYGEYTLFLQLFYLTCFPNARVLKLGCSWSPCVLAGDPIRVREQCELVLNTISKNERHEFLALRKLKFLEYTPDTYTHQHQHLQMMLPFFALPELERLYACNLTSISPQSPLTWKDPTVHSNLRSIELINCCIDVEAIETLLAHTPRLMRLAYVHVADVHDESSAMITWDADRFAAAIERQVGHQLVDLTIKMHTECVPVYISKIQSLPGFTQLRKVRLDPLVASRELLHSLPPQFYQAIARH
ncbi:hypothetical protein RRF57_010391 [Xylaria bambusicola]|uniref:F-box domain-containing protein n=1 Tax=Xylaria bambusicola TaxID=326684 RepID=A0AAN7US79_9PEZI